ncbi:MAG: tripartite tricarboxylate transporter substrate binding protein [Hylemonella sp.]|nr:tripartite tricarboxylate transporter substrate binding protein [Hylemonella sp.]
MVRQLFAAAALLGLSTCALAQAPSPAGDWPAKPVRIVVPYAPGGSSDTLGRMIAQQLQVALKQSFVVENRAGSGGTIGSAQVAKAQPDGYTLVVSGIGSHVIAPVEVKVFNPMSDFTHIALLGGPPLALVVHPSVPANTVPEFIAYARQLKEGLSWGSPGQGTHGHLVGELLAKQAQYTQTHISYKGAGPAVNDLLSGQILAAVMTYSSANAFVKSGRLKALATTASQRLADIPNVPTFAELGYPGLTSITWFSLSGPPGMPPALVTRINEEVRRGLKTEAAQKQLAFESMETQDWDAATFTRYVGSEIERWTPLVQSIKKPQ